jgi:serine/threonine-protein kinase
VIFERRVDERLLSRNLLAHSLAKPHLREAPTKEQRVPDQIEPLERLKAALADRYRIDREIGRGGMATVYLAEDLRHERQVAVKVLRPELVAVLGPERFLREIKLTARLSHPHILPLLDSGEADHILYYIMPYVEGESLRQKLTRETQLSIDDALLLGQQVASALDYAHRQGVIHRDIKPENILLHAGEAMVADFGIALALSAAGGNRLTETGLSMGTPEYMSPEQASGARQVDARSDIYSLGCVLYEMLGGDPPFTAHTPQAVIARQVLDPPPSLRTLRPSVPTPVEEVVKRALAKAPADRWQTADELLAQLKGFATPSGGITPTGVQPTARRPVAVASRTVAIVTGVTVIVAAAIALLWVQGGAGRDAAPAPRHTQLTFSGNVTQAEISPDGELLAYVEKGDTNRLFVQDLTGGTVIPIAPIGESVSSLQWSPDGSSLLFVGQDTTQRWVAVTYPRLGGPPRRLPHTTDYTIWAPDGSQVASWWQGTRRIAFTTLATGDTSSSVGLPDSIGTFWLNGDWSPNGRFIALSSNVASPESWLLWTVAVDGSGWHRLVQDAVSLSGPRWSPSGHAVYYLRQDELRKVRVAPDGEARGTPEVVLVGLAAAFSLLNPGLSLTADGRNLVFTKLQSHSNLWLATTTGRSEAVHFTTVQLTHGTAPKSPARLSPDGAWIAYVQLEGTKGDVFVVPTGGGMPRRVTSSGTIVTSTGGDPPFAPVWSSDGTALAFGALKDGKVKLHTVLVDRGQVRTYEGTEMGGAGLAWAPGKHILYSAPGNRNFHLLDPQTETEKPLVANDSVGWMFNPHYTPNGEQVAVGWNRRGRGTYVISLEDASQAHVHAGGWPKGWTADGSSVYVQEHGSDDIFLVPASGGEASVVATVPFEDASCLPVDRPDGLALLCNVGVSVSDAWMIENFDPAVR